MTLFWWVVRVKVANPHAVDVRTEIPQPDTQLFLTSPVSGFDALIHKCTLFSLKLLINDIIAV